MRGGGRRSRGILGIFLELCFAQGFDVGPEVGECRGDFLLPCGEMAVQSLFAGCESVVEVQGLDLERESALDVFEGKVPRRGMAGFDDVEEMRIGMGVEKCEGGGLPPSVDPVWAEVRDGVAFDGGEGCWGCRGGQVDVVFYRGEEGQNVLFELQSDEFFRTHVAHCTRARGVSFVPSVRDGLRKEVNPAAVGGGECEGGAEGGGCYGYCCLIELEDDQLDISRRPRVGLTLIKMSL